MAKYEFEIQILPRDVDKRQTLTSRLDVALAINGCRITAGEYVVTIERKSAAQVRSEAREAEVKKEVDEIMDFITPKKDTTP